MGGPYCKILGTIPKMDKRGAPTDGLKNKKTQDHTQSITPKRRHRQTLCARKVRGLANIEDSVDTTIRTLDEYINKSKERLKQPGKAIATSRNTSKTKKQKWEEKQIHRYFKRQTQEISHQKTLTWLRKGNLRRETESLIIAAQDNAIRTNYIMAKKDKTQLNSKCRICGTKMKRLIIY